MSSVRRSWAIFLLTSGSMSGTSERRGHCAEPSLTNSRRFDEADDVEEYEAEEWEDVEPLQVAPPEETLTAEEALSPKI
jgi:hypothetical protein